MSGFDTVSRWSYAFWIIDFIEFFESIPISDKLTQAYKDFLFLSLRDYENNIDEDPILELETNKEFRRAVFAGIKPEKIPLTCESAYLIKYLAKYKLAILKSSDSNQYQNAFSKLNDYFNELKTIFSSSIEIFPEYSKFSKEELLHYQSFFKLVNWILFERAAHFYETPELTQEYIKLIERLLNFYKTKSPLLNEVLTDVKLKQFCDGENNSERFRILHLLAAKSVDATRFFDVFGKSKPIDKIKLNNIIKEKVIIEPPTDFEKLSKLFLWYTRIEVLEAGDNIFSGLPVFESLINGLALKYKENNINNKLQMIEFIHPEDPKTHRSIAVLIETYGSFTDMSGWLIFRNIGGPYAGLGGSIYEGIQETIKKNKKQIDLQICKNISYDTLSKYLASKYKYEEEIIYYGDDPSELDEEEFNDYQQIESFNKSQESVKEHLAKLKQTKVLLGDVLGELLELIIYKICCKMYGYQNTTHSAKFTKKDPEIDIITKDNDNNLIIYESSVTLPLSKNEISKIEKKKILLNQKYSPKNIKFHYITTALSKETTEFNELRKQYEDKDIRIIMIEDLIDQMPQKEENKDKISKYKSIIKQYQKITR